LAFSFGSKSQPKALSVLTPEGSLRSQYGLGGLPPYNPSLGNGGLPQIRVNEFVITLVERDVVNLLLRHAGKAGTTARKAKSQRRLEARFKLPPSCRKG